MAPIGRISNVITTTTMPSFNQVTIIGTLGRAPELRYTPKGQAVCDISLAINRTWKSESGEKMSDVTWVDVTLWGKTAELCAQYVKKGHPLLISGRLAVESWDDKETGKKRSKMKVVGESMQFLAGKDAGSDEGEPPARTERPPARPPDRKQEPPKDDWSGGDEDSIPFQRANPITLGVA